MDEATYRFDPGSRIHWLEFDDKPDPETIALLKKEGWRWSSYRKQWRTNRKFAKPPEGIAYEDGGECDYASERPDRLYVAAGRAEERSEEAYERSNDFVGDLPLGQPVIRGTRSGRQHEKALERSHRQMNISVTEQKKAEHLESKARSSARHQAYKERPDVIHRRIKRLRAQITSMRNQMKHEPWGLWSAREAGDTAKIAEIEQRWAEGKAQVEERIALIEEEIAGNEEALAEKGGLLADKLDIEVGDVIKGGWRGLCEVKKINTRNGVLMSYTCQPMTNTWASKYVVPKDDVTGVIKKKDVTSIALLEAKMDMQRPYTPPPEPEKREFAVEQVETITVAASNPTAIFPTPTWVADQLAMEIPSTARFILEPSAGTGSLVQAVKRRCPQAEIHVCEIVWPLQQALEKQGVTVAGSDFLGYVPGALYDAVIMNPPFKDLEWLKHIDHALEVLRPGGTLAAIVSINFTYRDNRRVKEFRALVEEYGSWEELPAGSFAESGYMSPLVMLSMTLPNTEEKEPTMDQEQNFVSAQLQEGSLSGPSLSLLRTPDDLEEGDAELYDDQEDEEGDENISGESSHTMDGVPYDDPEYTNPYATAEQELAQLEQGLLVEEKKKRPVFGESLDIYNHKFVPPSAAALPPQEKAEIIPGKVATAHLSNYQHSIDDINALLAALGKKTYLIDLRIQKVAVVKKGNNSEQPRKMNYESKEQYQERIHRWMEDMTTQTWLKAIYGMKYKLHPVDKSVNYGKKASEQRSFLYASDQAKAEKLLEYIQMGYSLLLVETYADYKTSCRKAVLEHLQSVMPDLQSITKDDRIVLTFSDNEDVQEIASESESA